MTTRIAVGAAFLVAAATASPLMAQGSAPKTQVVISPTVLKSMTAQKSRSKKPFNVRVGMKRASTPATVASPSSAPTAPTSVRAAKSPKTVP